MGIGYFLTLFLIGVVGAFLSGMLGIGGAIVNYPMLLYIPAALGVAAFTPHQVSGIVAVQVFFATLSGVIALRKEKLIHFRLVAFMGTAIIIGSFIGGYGGRFLSGTTINIVYAVLATIAAIMMFVPKKGIEHSDVKSVKFNAWVAVLAALGVGVASGIVGAGGAFILVPIMLLILKIPTRITIGSSLAITFISSIGATIGKIAAGHVPVIATAILVLASVLTAPIGVRLGRRVNAKALRVILAVLIVATTIKIWFGMIH